MSSRTTVVSLALVSLLLLLVGHCHASCNSDSVTTLPADVSLTSTDAGYVHTVLTYTTAGSKVGTRVTPVATTTGSDYEGLQVSTTSTVYSADFSAGFEYDLSGSGCNTGAHFGPAYAVIRKGNTDSNWVINPISLSMGTNQVASLKWSNIALSASSTATYSVEVYVYTALTGGTCTLTIHSADSASFRADTPAGC